MKTRSTIPVFFAAVIISCLSISNVFAQGQATDTKAKQQPAENSMMITARLSIKPDKVKEFIAAAKEMIEKSNKESGCKFYQLYQDPFNSNKFIFVEEYKNQAAVDAHFASDYFKAFGPKMNEFVQEPGKIKVITVAKEVLQ